MRFPTFPASVICLFGLAACATWTPAPGPLQLDPANVHSKSRTEATVSVALLTDAQAHEHLGVDLAQHGLQALWMRVDNRAPQVMWFLITALDLDYYSADEVAAICQGSVPRGQFEQLRQRLRDESMRLKLAPGSTNEGLVFLPRAEAGRYVDIELTLPDRRLIFGFPVPLPDGDYDYERLRPDAHYAGQKLPDFNKEQLRKALEDLPCCTTDKEGVRKGDPLNLVITGSPAEAMTALTRAGWTYTHRLTVRSVSREVGAALAGTEFPTAPVSPLYALGRSQDLTMQRGRRTILQRNHLRLWLAPFTFEGNPVWIGQVSRDIGIKVTPKSPTLTTHIVAPEIDESREFLLQSLLARGLVARFGFVSGVGAAQPDAPRLNLTDDPYFTDGLRLVLTPARDPVAIQDVERLGWEEAAGPIAFGQSKPIDTDTSK
jgi:hypothetical protein